MKNDKKQLVKVYCDDNYFNKGIKPLFFELVQLTVHKNGPRKHGWRLPGKNNASLAHKIQGLMTPLGQVL